MEIEEDVMRVSKVKACWDFGNNSGDKSYKALRMEAILLPLVTLTYGPSAQKVS